MARFLNAVFCSGVSFAVLTGCYDGWEPNGGSQSTDPLPPIPGESPLFHLNVQSFHLNSGAVLDGTCFGATGTEQFRLIEWEERKAAMVDSLKPLAVSSGFTAKAVLANDCVTLKTIEDVAIDSELINLDDDPKDRPIVDLVAVFWDGDVAGTMSPAVLQREWASARKLRSQGRRVVSLFYFSLSNKTTGKFASWVDERKNEPGDNKGYLEATSIDTVDPTSAGQTARRSTAISDAAVLQTWILTQAGLSYGPL